MKPVPIDNHASNIITCKECGDLYIPSITNKKGRAIDSEGKFTKIRCRDCKRDEK
jgi:ribosomal protein S27E